MSSRFSYRSAVGRSIARRGFFGGFGGVRKVRRYYPKSRRVGYWKANQFMKSGFGGRVAWRAGGWSDGPGAKAELHAIDSEASVACDTTTAVALLNGCARGDDIGERTGRQIWMRWVDLNMICAVTAGTGTDQQQRVVVVQDMQPNGAACAWTDVFTSVSVLANHNLANRNRFRILFDRTVQLNATAEPGSEKVIRARVPLNLLVTFNSGNAGTVADIQTNSLYFMVSGSNVAGVTAGTVAYKHRVRFTDR